MKDWLIKHKNEIIVGVICSIIVTILLKASAILTLFISSASPSILGVLVDCIFRVAANQRVISLSLIILSFDIFSFLGIVCSYILKEKRHISDVETNNEMIRLGCLTHYATIEKGLITDSSKPQELTDAEYKLQLLTKRKQQKLSVKGLKVLIIFFSFGVIIITLSYLTYISYPISLFHDYQIDIIQISPYISEQDVKILNSRWVSMDGKADYDVIYEKINQIKKENNLTRGKQKRNK